MKITILYHDKEYHYSVLPYSGFTMMSEIFNGFEEL